MDDLNRDGIDWLAVAIYHAGNGQGLAAAAAKLGVTRGTITRWLREGIGKLPFARVTQLSKLGDVPLAVLAERMGPW